MAPSFDTVVSGKHPTANWKWQRISWQVSKYPKILRSRLKQHRGQLQRWGKLSFTLQRFVPLPNHLHSRRGYSPYLQAQGSLLSDVSTSQLMQAILPPSHPFSSAPPFFSSPPPSLLLPALSLISLPSLPSADVMTSGKWPENLSGRRTSLQQTLQRAPKPHKPALLVPFSLGVGGETSVCN